MMIKVAQYTDTYGYEKFKSFLNGSFALDMLSPVFGNKSMPTFFDGWRGKNMLNWFKFTNDDGDIVLEFYPDYYIVQKSGKNQGTHQLKLPKTINEFIVDMEKYNVPLYWTDWIDENFEPKEYLKSNEIKTYYINLLTQMDKSYEIL